MSSSSSSSTLHLQISITEEAARTVYRLSGDLDSDSASRLRVALAEPARAERDVVVDVAGLRFIDSSGLGVLVGALKRRQSIGRSLVLRDPTLSLRRVLEMTGLDQAFPLERSAPGPGQPAVGRRGGRGGRGGRAAG